MTKTKFLSAAFLILAITAYFGNDDIDDLAALKPAACSSTAALTDATRSARDLLGQIEQNCIDIKS